MMRRVRNIRARLNGIWVKKTAARKCQNSRQEMDMLTEGAMNQMSHSPLFRFL